MAILLRKLKKQLREWGVTALLLAGLCALAASPLAESLDQQVAYPALFHLRTLLGGPGLDPRIKMFSFDDKTASQLGDLDISLADWASVFESLDRRQP